MATQREIKQAVKALHSFRPVLSRLLVVLRAGITDTDRADDVDDPNDPDFAGPGIRISIGFTPPDLKTGRPASYGWQTGDNSFTGGAYGHPYWGVRELYRSSLVPQVLGDILDEIEDQLYQ